MQGTFIEQFEQLVVFEFGSIYEAAARTLRLLPADLQRPLNGAHAAQDVGAPYLLTISAANEPPANEPKSAASAAEITLTPATEGLKSAASAAEITPTPATVASMGTAPAPAAGSSTAAELAPPPLPKPRGNAEVLYEFTHDKARVATGLEAPWASLMAGNQEGIAREDGARLRRPLARGACPHADAGPGHG